MESPWKLHESDLWNHQGNISKNLHQNSMEPTSILMKKYYESFAKTILEAISAFSLSKFEKKEH